MPYRNSKLTRMLQESIGGNSLTTLLIAASMCSYNEAETLSTLLFGQRAKSIENKAVANVAKSAAELQRLLDEALEKLNNYEKLIKKLGAGELLESIKGQDLNQGTEDVEKFSVACQTESGLDEALAYEEIDTQEMAEIDTERDEIQEIKTDKKSQKSSDNQKFRDRESSTNIERHDASKQL